LLLGPVGDCPVDRLSRFEETRWAFDEQAPDVLAIFAFELPEKNPSTISRRRALASSGERRAGLVVGGSVSKRVLGIARMPAGCAAHQDHGEPAPWIGDPG
jgi:hypothetical protein